MMMMMIGRGRIENQYDYQMRESDGDSGHWSLGSPGLPRPLLRSESYERALEPEVI